MKISIIVPIYNVESYLENCLDSIQNQTYQDLEVILVDDGSPDNCGAICERYAARDDRFRVIHKENGGVAAARNTGLDAAAGDYIGFVDPDDWIEPDMYEYMLGHALQYKADVVVCDLRVLLNGQRISWLPKIEEVIVQDTVQTIESCLNGSMHDGCVNKLYRRALWDGLRFPNYLIAEDLSALWEIYKRTKVSVRLPEDKYIYYRRGGSITTTRPLQAALDDFRAIKKRHEEVAVDWSRFEELSAKRCLSSARDVCMSCFHASKEDLAAAKSELREIAAFCMPYLKKNGRAGLGRAGRLQLRLLRFYPSGWALKLTGLVEGMRELLHGVPKTFLANCYVRTEYELTFNRECIQSERINNLNAMNWDLRTLRTSKPYKRFLLRRRISAQLIHGSLAEKKDFFRWVWSKLTHKDKNARELKEFDILTNVEIYLKRAVYLDHMLVQANAVNNSNATSKRGKQVFIFAGVHYCDIGGGQRSSQLARTLNEMGYSVYYVHYLFHHLFYGLADSVATGEAWCPAIVHCHVDTFSVSALKGLVREDALFVFELPSKKYLPYLEYAVKNHIPVVYEHIDNWDSVLGEGFFEETIFRRFLNEASLITVTARLLGEKIQEAAPGREYLYLPNAVNSDLFEPMKDYEKPADLVQGGKTLLYFGSMWGEWLDWEKIIYLAENCPCDINMIGATAGIPFDIEILPSNIHFLGEKKQDTLPAYLAYSDIAILPFKNCNIGKYVSPLKIFEYIAMNKPVLATPLDDISGYPNVFASDNKEEWIRAVEQGWPVTDAGVFTSQNNWYARCNALLRQTRMLPEVLSKISIIVRSQNNQRTIFHCLSSLVTFSRHYDCEVIVVDSGTDGSYEQLQEHFGAQVKLLKCEEGAAVCGQNQAAGIADGEYLFFLDGSQWVTSESYLHSALEVLRGNPYIGAVSRSASWFSRGDYFAQNSDELPHHGVDEPAHLFRTDVSYLGMDGLLVRRTLFERLEGLDSTYRSSSFAAIDLSLKLKQAGYALALCPYMQVACLQGQAAEPEKAKHMTVDLQEKRYFEEKWRNLDPDLLQ